MSLKGLLLVALIIGTASAKESSEKNDDKRAGRSFDDIFETVKFGASKLAQVAKANGINSDLLRQASPTSLMSIGTAIMGVILVFVVVGVMFVALYPQNYHSQYHGRRKRASDLDSEPMEFISNLDDSHTMDRIIRGY